MKSGLLLHSSDTREYIQGYRASRGTANEYYGDQEPLGEQITKVDFAMN